MESPPFEVEFELDGWVLFWAQLVVQDGGEDRLAALRGEVVTRVRSELAVESLSSHPTVAGLRKLYRAAGCDPTRYRPSSEALLRRLLKGSEIPAILPLVDLNNCLSAEVQAPCCVIAEGTVTPPMVYRAGRPGESYESLKGPFDLEGKPVLCDAEGPYDAPITGSQRVKVTPETREALLVSYLPAGIVAPEAVAAKLEELVAAAPVARILWIGAS